jgi:hypothetical protein
MRKSRIVTFRMSEKDYLALQKLKEEYMQEKATISDILLYGFYLFCAYDNGKRRKLLLRKRKYNTDI